MQQQQERPLYWDNHEAFRRLLIVGSACLVMGFFFGDRVVSGGLMTWTKSWFPTVMWASGLMVLALCFLLHPKQYSIYPDSLVVEWWYFRRKAIPFDEVTELKAWSNLGKRHIIVMSRGEDYDFGWDLIAPRKIEVFAQRLEEAINRRRFYIGRDPIQIQRERSRKDKAKDKNQA